ncbi:hypothetical protein [Streptomyces sp. cmx-18-6]|uniref:hypothetical protein n=1 Tax=Streptomyces sp. cmx-18-6 TaxID=2790930 RepID=UPI00397FC4B1
MRDTASGDIGIVRRAPEGSFRLHALSGDRHREVDPDAVVELTGAAGPLLALTVAASVETSCAA